MPKTTQLLFSQFVIDVIMVTFSGKPVLCALQKIISQNFVHHHVVAPKLLPITVCFYLFQMEMVIYIDPEEYQQAAQEASAKLQHLRTCSKCFKVFNILSVARRHERECGMEKKYKCEKCVYASHRKGNLQGHMLRMHGINTCVRRNQPTPH